MCAEELLRFSVERMAEREGFEPPIALRLCLIPSQGAFNRALPQQFKDEQAILSSFHSRGSAHSLRQSVTVWSRAEARWNGDRNKRTRKGVNGIMLCWLREQGRGWSIGGCPFHAATAQKRSISYPLALPTVFPFRIFPSDHGPADTVNVDSAHVLFPRSQSADVELGHPVQFAVKRDKIYILDASGKQHKATLIKTALKDSGGD
jgi:hypothetical protein